MGSAIISPPAFKRKSKTVTNADLLNSVAIIINKFTTISGSAKSDGLWDGTIALQIQKEDGTWVNIQLISVANTNFKILAGNYDGAGFGNILVAAGDEKFPFSIRFFVTAQATQGKVDVIFVYA